MSPLLKPEIVNLVKLKAAELGHPVTVEQAKACIEALIWMQEKLKK